MNEGSAADADRLKGPGREHKHTFVAGAGGEGSIGPFELDVTPVTNGAYLQFVRASGYRPPSEQNYLRHWAGAGADRAPAAGAAQQPVRWVSLEDARSFCEWRGGRVPSEVEWALGAQGPDDAASPGVAARIYPWGNEPPNETFVPRPQVRPPFAPEDVGRRPAGASPFGILDMAGLVCESPPPRTPAPFATRPPGVARCRGRSAEGTRALCVMASASVEPARPPCCRAGEWTSEFVDERTRAAVLRGGSSFRPAALDQFGDNWYLCEAAAASNALTATAWRPRARPSPVPLDARARVRRRTAAPIAA